MRIDRRCDAFVRRLDQGDPKADRDPHVQHCPSCGVEMRLALRVREMLEAGRGPNRTGAPASFASRTAYIAATDREEAPNAGWRRLLSAPAFTVTAVTTALALSIEEAIPSLAGRLHLDVAGLVPSFPIHSEIFAVAIPILSCVAIGALAGLRLARRTM
jgi:hypothetical protein